jgi:O-antigen/teichoic acid export membrane protein
LFVAFGIAFWLSQQIVPWPALLATGMPEGAAAWTLWWLAASVLVLLPRNLLIAVYAAHGEFSRGEVFYAAFLFIQTAAIAVLLRLNAPPATVAAVYFASTLIVGWLAALADQRFRYGTWSLRLVRPSRAELRELGTMGRYYVVPALSDIALLRAPVLLLGVFSSNAAVVLFGISRTFTGLVRQLALQIATVSGIEMSRQHATADERGRTQLYLETGKAICGAVGLVSGTCFVFAEPFIRLWTHGRVPFDPWLILAFLAAIFIASPAQGGAAGLRQISKPAPLAVAALLQVIVSLALCPIVIPFWGATGAAVAVGLSEAAFLGIYVSVHAGREFQVSTGIFLLHCYARGVLLLCVSASASLLMTVILAPRDALTLAAAFAGSLALSAYPAAMVLLRPSRGVPSGWERAHD